MVVVPAFRDPPRDSYPLSNYPMFAQPIEAVNDVHTAIGRTRSGERLTLSPERIAGSDEVMHAAGTVGNAVAGGEAALERLCRRIAERVAAGGPDEAVEVEVVRDRHDAVAYFGGQERPLRSEVLESCRVLR